MAIQPKQYFPIRLSHEMRISIIRFSHRMGRERSDVVREALELGMAILEMPEYYGVRLNGVQTKKIMESIRAVLRSLKP